MISHTIRIAALTLLVALTAATPPLRAQDAAEIKALQVEVSDLRLKLKAQEQDAAAIRAEIKQLLQLLKEREQRIVKLQQELIDSRQEALASRLSADSLRERNLQLLDQIKKLTQANSGKIERPKDRIAINPPAKSVRGCVLKVDPKDGSLVEISLGTDDGLKQNHTLEVFRTKPEPRYLGVVRIVDTTASRSVGRMIVPPGEDKRPQVKEGDEVADRLAPEKDAKPESGKVNPPRDQVKAKITNVDDKDGNLVTVSAGKKNGLEIGHTLEVFRLAPQPKYLGLIRIISVTDDSAVGRLTAPPGAQTPRLMVGDSAWSALSRD